MNSKKYKETIDLLSDPIQTIPQAFATPIKHPCVGFCYMVLQNLPRIVELYINKNTKEYHELILKLIQNAGERKANNKNIHQRGEYMDQDTIRKDFSYITNEMKFVEMNSADENGLEFVKNTIFLKLYDFDIMDFMIITRSQETFLIIKLHTDKYLIIDSHKSKHGVVNTFDAINYITRYDIYKDLIHLGYKIDLFLD